jgi:hypothetical protein
MLVLMWGVLASAEVSVPCLIRSFYLRYTVLPPPHARYYTIRFAEKCLRRDSCMIWPTWQIVYSSWYQWCLSQFPVKPTLHLSDAQRRWATDMLLIKHCSVECQKQMISDYNVQCSSIFRGISLFPNVFLEHILFTKKIKQIEVTQCLLSFGAVSFVLEFAIQKF